MLTHEFVSSLVSLPANLVVHASLCICYPSARLPACPTVCLMLTVCLPASPLGCLPRHLCSNFWHVHQQSFHMCLLYRSQLAAGQEQHPHFIKSCYIIPAYQVTFMTTVSLTGDSRNYLAVLRYKQEVNQLRDFPPLTWIDTVSGINTSGEAYELKPWI